MTKHLTFWLIMLLAVFGLSKKSYASCDFASYGPNNWPPAGCSPYADTSPFNRRVPANPVLLSNSAGIVSRLVRDSAGGNQQSIFQGNYYVAPTGHDCSHPQFFATSSDPVYTVNSTTCGQSAAWGTLHIPNIARPGQGCSDHHIAIIDKTTGLEHDFYQFPVGGVSGGGTVPHVSACGLLNVHTGSGFDSPVTAAYFAEIAGPIRGPELQGGLIDHALVITVSCDSGTAVYPAHLASFSCANTTNAAPVGARFWLDYTDSQIAALAIPTWEKTIVTALAHYGAYVGDQGGPNTSSQANLEFESGATYSVYGAAQPVQTVAVAAGIGFNSGFGGYQFTLAGVDFANHLHVLDPCTALGTCGGQLPALAAPTGLTAVVQ